MGCTVGTEDGWLVGITDGTIVGARDGAWVSLRVGAMVAFRDGALVGIGVGSSLGSVVGLDVSLCTNRFLMGKGNSVCDGATDGLRDSVAEIVGELVLVARAGVALVLLLVFLKRKKLNKLTPIIRIKNTNAAPPIHRRLKVKAFPLSSSEKCSVGVSGRASGINIGSAITKEGSSTMVASNRKGESPLGLDLNGSWSWSSTKGSK